MVVLDGVVEVFVEFLVVPDYHLPSCFGLLPNTILTAFGCYYQFRPNGDASLSFRRKWVPEEKTVGLDPRLYFLTCKDPTGATKNVLVDTGSHDNWANVEIVAGADLAHVTLFQTPNHQLCLEVQHMVSELPAVAGYIFMAKY